MAEERKVPMPEDLQELSVEHRFIYILRKNLHLPWFLVSRAHHYMFNDALSESALKARYHKALVKLGLAEPKPRRGSGK